MYDGIDLCILRFTSAWWDGLVYLRIFWCMKGLISVSHDWLVHQGRSSLVCEKKKKLKGISSWSRYLVTLVTDCDNLTEKPQYHVSDALTWRELRKVINFVKVVINCLTRDSNFLKLLKRQDYFICDDVMEHSRCRVPMCLFMRLRWPQRLWVRRSF